MTRIVMRVYILAKSTSKKEKTNMKVRTKSSLALGAGVVAVVGCTMAPVANAATNSSTTLVRASIGSTISVTSSPTVTMSITPVSGGTQASTTDTVTVNTNNGSGYTLNLADSDATLTLTQNPGVATLAANPTAPFTAPVVLANNAWGYAVGSGTTGSIVSTQFDTTATYTGTPNAAKYAAITASGSGVDIKKTTATATNDTLTIYYSAKADTSKPSGNYEDNVVYTATTNP